MRQRRRRLTDVRGLPHTGHHRFRALLTALSQRCDMSYMYERVGVEGREEGISLTKKSSWYSCMIVTGEVRSVGTVSFLYQLLVQLYASRVNGPAV